jgi:hypothetical protein
MNQLGDAQLLWSPTWSIRACPVPGMRTRKHGGCRARTEEFVLARTKEFVLALRRGEFVLLALRSEESSSSLCSRCAVDSIAGTHTLHSIHMYPLCTMCYGAPAIANSRTRRLRRFRFPTWMDARACSGSRGGCSVPYMKHPRAPAVQLGVCCVCSGIIATPPCIDHRYRIHRSESRWALACVCFTWAVGTPAHVKLMCHLGHLGKTSPRWYSSTTPHAHRHIAASTTPTVVAKDII